MFTVYVELRIVIDKALKHLLWLTKHWSIYIYVIEKSNIM